MRRFLVFLALSFFLPSSGVVRTEVRLPVIMYHHVTEDVSKAGDYVVTTAQLEGDLKYLRDHGCTAVSAAQLVDFCLGQGNLPEKPVLITFDDGQLSVLDYALPLLEKYDMCAVAALVGAYCDREERLEYRSPEYSYMTWFEAGQLAASGRFELAAHTQSMHEECRPRRGCLPKNSEPEDAYRLALNSDLETVERSIENASGYRPYVFAYPFGFHCDLSDSILSERGYSVVLTCESRVNVLTGEPSELMSLARFNRPASADRERFFAMLGL